ncbi:hypothetical protein Peur_001459 [Populus x canadensis]
MLKIALLKCLHMFQIWFLVPKVFTSFCVVIYQAGALPAPSSEPSTPASIGSQEVQRPPRNAASPSAVQRSNGISGVAELASGLGISKGIHTEEETSNRTSWLKPAFFMRTRSATNSVVQQILVYLQSAP